MFSVTGPSALAALMLCSPQALRLLCAALRFTREATQNTHAL